MNTNKKHKNKNRPKPNPPLQKVEDKPVASNTEDQLLETTESALKEENRVPEIISEVIQSIVDSNQPSSDVPKKPKRNRAKKEKQDVSSEENQEKTVAVILKKEENIPTGDVKLTELDEVTPAVRKKKNKKKHQQDPSKVDIEESNKEVLFKDDSKIETHVEGATEVSNTEANKEVSLKDSDIKIQTQEDENINKISKIDELEQDFKPQKKKNKKKKNRTESEKSDKGDEIMPILSSQQILDTANKSEITLEKEINLSSPEKQNDNKNIIPKEKESSEEQIQDKHKVDILKEKDEPKEDVPKQKKKNKKDKKQVLKSDDSETKETANRPKHKETESQDGFNIEFAMVQPQDSVVTDEQKNTPQGSPKPKAKIAKPVEKKRKEKANDFKSETETYLPKNNENIPDELSITSNISEIRNLHLDDTINIPLESKHENQEPICDKSLEELSNKKASSTVIENLDNIDESPCSLQIEAELKTDDIKKDADDKDMLEEMPFIEIKAGKKKKKQKKELTTEMKDVTMQSTDEKHPQKQDDTTEIEPKILQDLPSLEDIEVSNINTEGTEIICDTTPDFIQYPRSASQQQTDNNNNMVIQEIRTPDVIKLSIPLMSQLTSTVLCSGETPECGPEKLPTTINITEIENAKVKTVEPEKTDIKSKMMEVNQDMEELRMSIERSLAELTAIEKTEEDIQETPKKDMHLRKLDDLKSKNDDIACIPSDQTDKIIEEKQGSAPGSGLDDVKPEIITKEIHEESHSKTGTIPLDQSLPMIQDQIQVECLQDQVPPQCPPRKDNKGKKSKRKGKQELELKPSTSTTTLSSETKQDSKKDEKVEQKTDSSEKQDKEQQEKGKQQSSEHTVDSREEKGEMSDDNFEPIEHFEDALTSSVDDVNKTFEIIANEANHIIDQPQKNPEINIIAPPEEAQKKQNPVSPPKNLLGQPDMPVPSNRNDYKKEKNKPPNERQAKVKIKDSIEIENAKISKESKESQTENKMSKNRNTLESFSYKTNENGEYVYKYSFRKVFLQSACHVCKRDLSQVRVPCNFCSLLFYCSQKHKDEDWPRHQSLCFAVSTIVHLKDQKHIYEDAKNVAGQTYRLLRMQMIVSCEKVLKRKLVPWEQEALLYPRICADVACREWRQSKLVDCKGCGQISYCSDNPDHLSVSHQRWCKSYSLYQKMVSYQQSKGRLEPKLPSKVMVDHYQIPGKINEVLASMFEEKIDMSDIEYAAMTQLATAPLTAAYSYQLFNSKMNSICANGIAKKSVFILHVVGAELKIEADVLHKWEIFFLHLRPDIKELKVVLIGPDLNVSNLPLDLLGKIKLCDNCQSKGRRVTFNFEDKKSYRDYWTSDEFVQPDIVCAFNPSIDRASVYNGKDTWPASISCILKLKIPFLITAYSIEELRSDLSRVKECSPVNHNVISEPKFNCFASVRPDRNFITDDDIPLLFKNYCFALLCGNV